MKQITIATNDGTAPAWLFAGDNAGAAGVILYMDIFGPREALFGMAETISEWGYRVLLPDLFYRVGDYGPFDPKTAFTVEETKNELRGMAGATTQAMTIADTQAFIAALDDAGATGPIGGVGYCFGGARALSAAAAYPDRIQAAASFHGGNLASEAEDSPHRRAADIKGRVYVGCAGVDGSFPPEQSAILAQALREAEVDHIIENYVGKAHGWAVPDHSVYDEDGAARHWKRLLELFSETLG